MKVEMRAYKSFWLFMLMVIIRTFVGGFVIFVLKNSFDIDLGVDVGTLFIWMFLIDLFFKIEELKE